MPVVTVPEWQELVDDMLLMIEELGQDAIFQTRELMPQESADIESDIEFSEYATIKVAFDTDSGKTTFDNVSVERTYSHTGYMEYDENITSEMFVLFQNKRLKIISIEDIGAINGVLELRMSELGDESMQASKS